MSTSTVTKPVTLSRNLGIWHVIIIGLSYIQPTTLFDTFGMVSKASHQHTPMSYVLALIAILLTSLSYGQMIRAYPSSGSAYTYAQKAIHPTVGFMVGWSSWLDYLLMPMVNIVLAVIYFSALFPEVNTWFWVVAFTSIMTIVNLLGAKIVAYFNSWIVTGQLLIIAFFTYLVYTKLSQGLNADGVIDAAHAYQLWSLTPFFNATTEIMPLIAGATILCFSFTGFDSLSTLAEETKDAKNKLPKAIFLTSLITGLIFIVSTYFIQLYFSGNPSTYFTQIDETQPEILLLVGGSLFQSIVLTFGIITVVASGISAHAGVSRLMYVMGRDGVISRRVFGYIHPKLRTPVFNILIAGLVALMGGFVDLDFVVHLISFGALTAFSFVNLSVIFEYALKNRRLHSPKQVFLNLIVPTLGFITIFIMWLNVENTSLYAGLSWGLLGFVYLLWLTKGFSKPIPTHQE
ncbi:APC family permease [Moraxella sp. ZY200743]|uniref:APC family permease n=1 Tax=Moraxella sp. ZY200743 TaxID=2911970 RepID=UPI003D7DBE7B